MSEQTKQELIELSNQLEDQIYNLNSFVENNEDINHDTWYLIDTFISEANMTLSKIQEILNYS
ncbi:hypothetical protein [Robertmurraya siralis]|uniref:hypothetical protein n=1 Tax=Robertmurraya siralis TaxID=77777 RepID=UPI0010F7A9FC|nr:hypothetical protein [Robertmurraya siralis]